MVLNMPQKKISVIVVNWNGLHHLDVCLKSLMNQKLPADDLILVDNGSCDGSIDFVRREFPSVRVIELNRNLGFCGGNNVGIMESSGDFVALINNDTEAHPCWLEEGIKALEQNPDAGFVASRICLFDHREIIDTTGDEFFSSGYPGKRGWLDQYGPNYDTMGWVFGASGGAVIYRRTMLDDIGLFDEDYSSFQEDVDLSFRGLLKGYRCLYVPDAVVYHKVGATAPVNSIRRQYLSHRNHWFTLIKDLPGSLWVKFLGDILLAEILVGISCTHQGRLGVFFKARWDVIRSMSTMLRKRKIIQMSRRVPLDAIQSLIRRDWITVRRQEKIREATRLRSSPNV